MKINQGSPMFLCSAQEQITKCFWSCAWFLHANAERESCWNTDGNKTFQTCCRFSPDDACAITDRTLCVPEVYGPTLGGHHVVFEARFSTAANHQW